mmetsp:Transcript_18512/g.43593  ORF Transcript_18512/g.43593 Transcript_18512/m.43593 type:complete len:269 (-) Transcript_18512:129-935(-)
MMKSCWRHANRLAQRPESASSRNAHIDSAISGRVCCLCSRVACCSSFASAGLRDACLGSILPDSGLEAPGLDPQLTVVPERLLWRSSSSLGQQTWLLSFVDSASPSGTICDSVAWRGSRLGEGPLLRITERPRARARAGCSFPDAVWLPAPSSSEAALSHRARHIFVSDFSTTLFFVLLRLAPPTLRALPPLSRELVAISWSSLRLMDSSSERTSLSNQPTRGCLSLSSSGCLGDGGAFSSPFGGGTAAPTTTCHSGLFASARNSGCG